MMKHVVVTRKRGVVKLYIDDEFIANVPDRGTVEYWAPPAEFTDLPIQDTRMGFRAQKNPGG